jgi:hypothetical protein
VKAHIYDEVDLMDWLSGQVRAGCTLLNLRCFDPRMDGGVLWDWPLSTTVDVAHLTNEVEQTVTAARGEPLGFRLLGVFSYRPERWMPMGMALFLEGTAP